MGAGGAGFAQGFAHTLTTLGPIIQRNQQERESLELQKKLATASLAKHEAETALITKELQSGRLFDQIMAQGVPSEGMSSPDFAPGAPFQTMAPFDPGKPEHLQYAMGQGAIGPKLRDKLISEQFERASNRSAMREFLGGMPEVGPAGQTGASPGTPPPTASAPMAAGPAQAIPVAQQGGRMVPKRSITIGSDGKASYSINNEIVKYDAKTGTIRDDNGMEQIVSYAVDPLTGQPVTDPATGQPLMTPVGAPMPSKEVLEIRQQLTGLGVDPNSPMAASVAAAIQKGKLIQDGKARDAYYEQLEAEVAKLPDAAKRATPAGAPKPMETPGVKTSIGGARKAAADKEMSEGVLKVAAETRAKIETEMKNKPLEGAAKDKYVALESIQRKSVRALELFRPEYVGKPFIDKFKGEFAKAEKLGKDYAPGALAGAMREFFGNASPEEVEFRRSILEMADDVLRARSGAAISESEYKRVTGFLAQLSDEPTTFKAAMERVVKDTTAQMESAVKLATTPASKLTPSTPEPKKKDPGKVQLGGSIRRNASGMLEYVPAGRK
jgi:hypothetical protein